MEDQRIRMTKKCLKEALIQLLKEKELSKISVRELCSRACINRTTFYKYYEMPGDVLADIAKNFQDDIRNFFSENPVEEGKHLTAFLQYQLDNKETALLLLTHHYSASGDLPLLDTLGMDNFLRKDCRGDNALYEYASLYYSAGCSAIIENWLKKETPEPAAYMASVILAMTNFRGLEP